MDELSALRRDKVTLGMQVKGQAETIRSLQAAQPKPCRACGRCDASGMFLWCRRTGLVVGPDDYCSRWTEQK